MIGAKKIRDRDQDFVSNEEDATGPESSDDDDSSDDDSSNGDEIDNLDNDGEEHGFSALTIVHAPQKIREIRGTIVNEETRWAFNDVPTIEILAMLAPLAFAVTAHAFVNAFWLVGDESSFRDCLDVWNSAPTAPTESKNKI